MFWLSDLNWPFKTFGDTRVSATSTKFTEQFFIIEIDDAWSPYYLPSLTLVWAMFFLQKLILAEDTKLAVSFFHQNLCGCVLTIIVKR